MARSNAVFARGAPREVYRSRGKERTCTRRRNKGTRISDDPRAREVSSRGYMEGGLNRREERARARFHQRSPECSSMYALPIHPVTLTALCETVLCRRWKKRHLKGRGGREETGFSRVSNKHLPTFEAGHLIHFAVSTESANRGLQRTRLQLSASPSRTSLRSRSFETERGLGLFGGETSDGERRRIK